MRPHRPIRAVAVEVAPDLVSSSDAYARRFCGRAGTLFLARQSALLRAALADKHRVTILDIGGGHGQLTPALLAYGHDVTVLGSEPASGPDRTGGARFVAGRITAPPFAEGEFDTVLAFRMLAHVADWRGFLGELCRVARRTVVVDFPSWMSANAASAALYPAKRLYERDTRPFHSFHTATISRALSEHGFIASFCSGEWLLPMVMHRMGHAAAPLRWVEAVGERTGLTRRLGNPVILRADRLPMPGTAAAPVNAG